MYAGMATDWSGACVEEMLYYPWGQEWTNDNWDARFASMPDYDYDLDLQMTWARLFANDQGRWLSPDPLAGSILNPQSLNRYAYVGNNPTTLIDPLGLDGQCGSFAQLPCNPFSGPVSPSAYGNPATTTAAAGQGSGGFNEFDAVAAASGASTLMNTFGYAPVSPFQYLFTGGILYRNYYKPKRFDTWGQYAYWLTGIAALPESKAYANFAKAFPYLEGADPNATYEVEGQRRGFTTNYQAGAGGPDDALWLDLFAVMGANPDFDLQGHGGNPSWRIGDWEQLHVMDLYSLYETGQWYGAEWHSEFAPWNPIHWLDFAASKVIPNSGWSTFTCSLNGGCSSH